MTRAAEPPYRRIVADIRRRIDAGELRPGDRVPSARRITQDWGVAIATATKALAALAQDGLVRAVPGVGTVVAGTEPAAKNRSARPRPARDPSGEPTRDRIVRAAIAVADGEGLAALSMRRVAAEFGVATMSLYRHLRDKEHLILLMADEVFGEEPLPEAPPAGWRPQLELYARTQWAIYRRHPWLAQVMSFTRPLIGPRIMSHAEWPLRALDGLGLDPATMLHTYITLANYVRGTAVNLEAEAQAEQDSGVDSEEWMDAHLPAMAALAPSLPVFTGLLARLDSDFDLDSLFEFGLRRLLDGFATLVGDPVPGSR